MGPSEIQRPTGFFCGLAANDEFDVNVKERQ
jgi:hypothetical protein